MRAPSNKLPSYVAELLEAERQAPRPSAGIERRVRGRVAATLVASAAGATSLAASSAAAATVVGVSAKVGGIASLGVKLSVLVVGVGVLGTAGGIAWRHQLTAKAKPATASHASTRVVTARRSGAPRIEASPASEKMEAPTTVPTQLLAAPTAALPPAVAAGRKSPGRSVHTAETAEYEDYPIAGNLAEESPLIDLARAAIGTGRPADALLLLGQHTRRFPHGQLEEEREALGVLALVASGDTAGSRVRAEMFRRRFPRSIQLDIVEAAVASKK